jgi:hypothetical protein
LTPSARYPQLGHVHRDRASDFQCSLVHRLPVTPSHPRSGSLPAIGALASRSDRRYIRDVSSFAPLFKRARQRERRARPSPAIHIGPTSQGSTEALTGNRCSSRTFDSNGGAELCSNVCPRCRRGGPSACWNTTEGLNPSTNRGGRRVWAHSSTSSPADLPARDAGGGESWRGSGRRSPNDCHPCWFS